MPRPDGLSFSWYPCRGVSHTPPRHPAGMNDCTRVGGHQGCRPSLPGTCRGELHSPPKHPAGMNDCLRGRGGPCGGSEVWPGTCRGELHSPPYGRGAGKRAGAHCEKAMQALRDHFIHYEKAAQVLRGRFTHCDDAAQVLHGHFAHCGDAAQVLHSRFTHCDKARNGAYAFAPLPGYTPFMSCPR